MDDSIAHKDASPVLTEIPRFEASSEPAYVTGQPAAPRFEIPRLNAVLFLLTFLTTSAAGADMAGAQVSFGHPFASLVNLFSGFSFSIPLMLILFSHEMGHYLTSRRHGVDSSLPYFIPAPFHSIFFIGTFGAFIRMRSLPRTRRAMFDIGAAGPWAGFVIAMAAIIIGLTRSQVTPLDTSQGGLQLGNSLIFWSVSRLVLGVDPNNVNVNLDPIAFAGWIGLFVTTLNLLPVGQLDGGHVVYSLFGGRWHHRVSRLFTLGCLLMVMVPVTLNFLFHTELTFWGGWLLWFAIVIFLGLGHPSTVDPETPLVGMRKYAAWATVALFIGTFSPVPAWFAPPSAEQPPDQDQGHQISVMHHAPIDHARILKGLTIRL
jgi:membrane-associated protease RseP (regulator of RpoE activity)